MCRYDKIETEEKSCPVIISNGVPPCFSLNHNISHHSWRYLGMFADMTDWKIETEETLCPVITRRKFCNGTPAAWFSFTKCHKAEATFLAEMNIHEISTKTTWNPSSSESLVSTVREAGALMLMLQQSSVERTFGLKKNFQLITWMVRNIW